VVRLAVATKSFFVGAAAQTRPHPFLDPPDTQSMLQFARWLRGGAICPGAHHRQVQTAVLRLLFPHRHFCRLVAYQNNNLARSNNYFKCKISSG